MDNTERQIARQVECDAPRLAAHAWGPFTPDIDEAERRARLRCLRTLVKLFCGAMGREAYAALHAAESDPGLMGKAWMEVDRLPSRNLRAALATYAAVHAPEVRR